LTNKIIGLDVIINQDSIDGYEGLGFDVSTFNQNGLGDLFTIGISMPIRMVQYQDSCSWSKYCHRLFPFDLSGMITEMNNIHELFHQNITENFQTDIDGSLDFSLNPITIESLEKYLKTFHTPPLDIEQISSIWDQLLTKKKQWKLSLMINRDLQSQQQLFPFQSSHQCFISVSRNTDSLNQLWNCYSSYIFKQNQLHKILNYFQGMYQSSV
jgi:hypothetical protein